MSNTETKLLAEPEADVEAMVAHLLHEFRNQLAGLKLYAAFLKKSLANNTLDRQEGVEVCEKIIQQIDALTRRARETARGLNLSGKK